MAGQDRTLDDDPVTSAAADHPVASAASIPLYCINLPSSPDRRARMTRRFAELDLLDHVRFVPAIERISPLVDQHLARAGIDWAPNAGGPRSPAFLSHLKALETFLEETSASYAIIFEDDVLLHRDWHEQLAGVLDNLEDGRAALFTRLRGGVVGRV